MSASDKPVGMKKPLPMKKTTAPAEDSGSETEPEEDSDEVIEVRHCPSNLRTAVLTRPLVQFMQPRPAFQRKPGQPFVGPLALDREHKVPARINMILREYQRDGVRFFWKRYKENKGGLLGDDMGLVSSLTRVLVIRTDTLRSSGQVPNKHAMTALVADSLHR